MTSNATCESCGAPLSEGAEFAFCPQCLAREAQQKSDIDSGLAETQASASTRFQPPSEEELDAFLPNIDVTELIGHGGMGAVYRGRQVSLDRVVAIRILPREIQAPIQSLSSSKQLRENRTWMIRREPAFDFTNSWMSQKPIIEAYIPGARSLAWA